MPSQVIRVRAVARVLGAGLLLALGLAGQLSCTTAGPKPKSKAEKDRYAEYVWPPPPDEARIRLVDILQGRADVEASSGFQKALFGASPEGALDRLKKPFAVEYDAEGRILVTDPSLGALFRFDRKGRRMDVFGTTGAVRLKTPLGIGLSRDGTIYVADAGIRKVLAYDAQGKMKSAFGKEGDFENPADVAVSPDGKKLYVADSKAHRVDVVDAASGRIVASFGKRGEGPGEFNFPSALTFDGQGNLLVVDQINARIQIFSDDGEFLDQLGGLGVTFGKLVRPKDIAVDDAGFLYVTDAAFNNVQIFDAELELLTFVGDGGTGPGRFQVASGVACHGNEFAVVDQVGARVQLFQFVGSKQAK